MIKNGYCEITVGGKKVGLKFNMYAIELFSEIKGRSTTIKNLTTIVYAGMLGNCYAKQTEPELSFEDISDWVDEQMINQDETGELATVSECFQASNVLKATIEKASNGAADEETKKKMVEWS